LRRITLTVALLFLLFLSYYAATSGYAPLLTEKALAAGDVQAAQRAAQLSAGDPRTHVVLGALLEATEDSASAIQHYQTAVALRPDDYVLRLQLARAQELRGDATSAISSASIAVLLAPSYSQPHWQLGNILIRAGRDDGGFSELRQAAATNPQLLTSIVDLAGQLSGDRPDYLAKAIDPKTPEAYRALFSYFKKRGSTANAIHWLQAGRESTREERRGFLTELVAAKKFDDALRVWWIEHPPDPDTEILENGGFEEETDLTEPGFGWRAGNPDKSVVFSLDNVTPKEGRQSLRIDFNGATAGGDLISRLVLLPGHCKLSFSFRTDNLVSGGPPYVVVVDAITGKPLAQTEIFPQTTDGWRDAVLEFTPTDPSGAVRIALQRQNCSAPQCPIFGKLWLDDFFLEGPGVVRRKVN